MLFTKQFAAFVTLFTLALPVAGIQAAEPDPVKLNDKTTRLSYSLGYQIGGDFKRQGVEMNAEAVVMGIEDALSEAEPKIPKKAMNEILSELKRKVVSAEQEQMRKSRREEELRYLSEGKKFMEENAGKAGVTTTASGLQYKIIEPGKGKTPVATDKVTVNYRGTLTNGNEFDSSYSRGEPITFSLNGVIKGWTEGLQLIKEGGKIQLVIPPELAYGARGPLAHRTLIFDIELISIGPEEQAGSKPE